MKITDINGLMHDLIGLHDWQNPLDRIWIKEKFEIDLINAKHNYPEEDSVVEFFEKKSKWFMDRIKKLKGDLTDFKKAVIKVYGAKEKVEIIYKGKRFEKEKIYGEHMKHEAEIKKQLIKLKSIKLK